jgi:hypothetical protein
MCRLADVLQRGFYGVYTDIMFRAVTCGAFFGGLRVSELISCKLGDVRFTGNVDLNINFWSFSWLPVGLMFYVKVLH